MVVSTPGLGLSRIWAQRSLWPPHCSARTSFRSAATSVSLLKPVCLTAGFRTSYSRSGDALATPEVIVTMRQLYLPSRGGFGATGVTADGPSLRTMTATFIDRTQVMDGITVDYGLTMDSVSMNQKLNTVSPFGRVNVDLGSTGLVQVAYSSGVAPTELAERPLNRSEIRDQDLSQDLAVLAALPLVSMRNGNAKVQRSDSVEVGYNKVSGRRMYSFGAYRERIKDALLTLASDQDVFNDDNLLMDLRSRSSAFNGGNFERWGYMASVSQAARRQAGTRVGLRALGWIVSRSPSVGVGCSR